MSFVSFFSEQCNTLIDYTSTLIYKNCETKKLTLIVSSFKLTQTEDKTTNQYNRDNTSYYRLVNFSTMSSTNAVTIIAIWWHHVHERQKKKNCLRIHVRDDFDFSEPLSATRLACKAMSLETRDDKLKMITEENELCI